MSIDDDVVKPDGHASSLLDLRSSGVAEVEEAIRALQEGNVLRVVVEISTED